MLDRKKIQHFMILFAACGVLFSISVNFLFSPITISHISVGYAIDDPSTPTLGISANEFGLVSGFDNRIRNPGLEDWIDPINIRIGYD